MIFFEVIISWQGAIDSGAQTLFQVGIPGLDFPGYVRRLAIRTYR